ncbi:MAG: NAD(P)-binding protein [Mycoplasma sp.]
MQKRQLVAKQYDAIIIGAGNGGLMAALKLLQNNYSVLILERHNVPGGDASSFKRGRFEFDVNLDHLHDVGQDGILKQIWNELDIYSNINWIDINAGFKYVNDNFNYQLVLDQEQFIIDMLKFDPQCEYGLRQLFSLGNEANNAYKYLINHLETKQETLMNMFPNFFKYLNKSASFVLDKLKITGIVRDIINAYWLYLGCDLNFLSFNAFASAFSQYINKQTKIAKKRAHEISVKLEQKIRNMGGEVWYNTSVSEILFDFNNHACGVLTANKKEIKAKVIIADINPHYVFSSLIAPNHLDKNILNLLNNQQLSFSNFHVYLGLNKRPNEMGINHCSYVLSDTSDYNKQLINLKNLNTNQTLTAQCLTVLDPKASQEGSAIVRLSTYFNAHAWDQVKVNEYFKTKEAIAKALIKAYEQKTKATLTPYIEDVEIASAISYAHFTNALNGTNNGYKLPLEVFDNQFSYNNLIPNLFFVGKSVSLIPTHAGSYLSGWTNGIKVVNYLKGKK